MNTFSRFDAALLYCAISQLLNEYSPHGVHLYEADRPQKGEVKTRDNERADRPGKFRVRLRERRSGVTTYTIHTVPLAHAHGSTSVYQGSVDQSATTPVTA